MRGHDRRLADLEQRLAPPEKYIFYGEDPRASGMFRRGGDDSGRLMTHDEVTADAAAVGANVILVVYESKPLEPSAGMLAGPDIMFGEGTVAIFMPNNHRDDGDELLT